MQLIDTLHKARVVARWNVPANRFSFFKQILQIH
jgi:hypothetical protein